MKPEMPVSGFHVVCAEDYEEMSRLAAVRLVAQLRRKADSLFILATGGSPTGAYEILAREGGGDLQLCSRVRIMKLDEWGGVDRDDPATCETYLQRHLIKPLGIGEDRFFSWQSQPENVEAECARMKTVLEQQGPADVCVLGLGLNGHLGFNEPAAVLAAGPHRAELSPESMTHAMLASARSRPGFGLTLGMGDILRSREIVLVINGAHKRAQLQRLLRPEISTQFPGSLLWLHPSVTIYCDREALPK